MTIRKSSINVLFNREMRDEGTEGLLDGSRWT